MILPDTKVCTKCQEEKSMDEFKNDRKGRLGKHSWCKDCVAEYKRAHYQKNKKRLSDKGRLYYKENASRIKNRVSAYVKRNAGEVAAYQKQYRNANEIAIKERELTYRKANAEKRKVQQRQYFSENKVAISMRCAAYRMHNREALREYHKRYNKDNKERIRESHQRYYQKHPERKRVSRRKYRAKQRGVNERFGLAQIRFARSFWMQACAICGKTREEEGKALAVDHWLPLSKGHPLTMETAVLMCGSCNSRKRNKYPTEVYEDSVVARIATALRQQVAAWEEGQS